MTVVEVVGDLADGLAGEDLGVRVGLRDGLGVVGPARRERRRSRPPRRRSAQRSQLLGSSHRPWMKTTGLRPVALARSTCSASWAVTVGWCRPLASNNRARLRRLARRHRSAPSRRMVSPLSIGFSTICAASARVLLRLAETLREGIGLPRALRSSSGSRASIGVSKIPGAIVQQRMPARQVARDRKRHADDAAFGGRVGDLADLAVEGRDRRGVDDHAALAVLVRLVDEHRGRREAQDVEGADQVDGDDHLEGLERRAGPASRRSSAPSRCPRSRR